jgi:hypothetical protein
MEIDARMELARQQSEEIRSIGFESGSSAPGSSYRDSQIGEYLNDRIGRYLDFFA